MSDTISTIRKAAVKITKPDRYAPLDTIQRLELRLMDGYRLIEARRAAGIDTAQLEAFWLELLHQYEALVEGTDQ